MSRLFRISFASGWLLPLVLLAPVFAENDGLDDLDKATELKVTAESLDDLNEVVDRLDTAIEKGLDEANSEFARQLLISSLLQRGQLFSAAVFNVSLQDPQRGLRSMQFRQFALTDLQRVVGYDDKLIDAHLLIGKLQSLPLGDTSAARRALSLVAKSSDASPEQQAEALALRSAVQKDEEKQIADLNRAVELQPEKPDYLRLRSNYWYGKQKYAEALADIDSALTLEPDHAATNELRGVILLNLEKYDDAIASFDRASELMPDSALPYQHRGLVYQQQGDLDKALEQLTKALKMMPDNADALLVRANIYFQLKQTDKSLEDVEQALRIEPGRAQAHLMRAEILAATNRMDQAIAQLERLLQLSPGNTQLLNRLSTFYLIAGQPRKAIELATKVIEQDSEDYAALRFRADAYLNIGKHAEAIADFEKAFNLKEDDESLLNNFAWVLATSPDDELRDGARAVKLATKASELTGHQTPHVLSTLAAAYAETGDYDSAVKWSEKSVEMSQKAVESATPEDDRTKLEADVKQLQQELTNFREKKPVRERQTAEEATDAPAATDQTLAPSAPPAPARTADF